MTCPIWAWVASLYWRQNSMMFTPCWPRAVPTGGAGVAWPALIWSLTMAVTFLRGLRAPFDTPITSCGPSGPRGPPAVARVLPASDLGDLVEAQLDRGLPVEDVHQDLELALVHVDLADGPVEVGEGPGD